MEFLLIAISLVALFGSLFAIVNEMRKKDEMILSYQKALVDAYSEIELMKLGVMK